MIRINSRYELDDSEVELTAIRASGPGGQAVNKTSSAIHLRFDIQASSLPERIKTKLLSLSDRRLTKDGAIVIKANEHRTQLLNKEAAKKRLVALIADTIFVPKYRVPTKPTYGSVKRRLEKKAGRSQIKAGRKKPRID